MEPRATAVVTGAASDVGLALAERLARDGRDLVLVARRKETVEAPARRIAAEHGVDVELVEADLTDLRQLGRVAERVAGDPRLELLVNSADFGVYGPFAELDPAFADDLVGLHVRAPVRLTHAALPGLVARGRGAVVNVASLLALGGPLHAHAADRATFAAVKAFLLTFTQGLSAELEGSGVQVMAVLPGLVQTEAAGRRRGGEPLPAGMMSAADVAQALVAGLDLGEVVCVPGLDDVALFEALRALQTATLFGAASGHLARRYLPETGA